MSMRLSAHGGSGYAPQSYWEGDAIVCGACGWRIENPQPTGGRWYDAPGIMGWLGKGYWAPTWPRWISPPKERVR